MGFSEDQSTVALEATGGDVVAAAELLLSQQPPAAAPSVQPRAPDSGDAIAARERERNEAALRMALEESMRDAPPAPAPAPAPTPVPSPPVVGRVMSDGDMLAEAIRASLELELPSPRAQAAAPAVGAAGGGGGGGGGGGQPQVEDVLRQHSASLEGHPLAVDTLVAVLQMILDNPKNAQYRRLRLSNRKFRATLAGAHGGIEILLALGFVRDTSQGAEALVLQRDDPGLLWMGKSALEVSQQSSAYMQAKAEIDRVEAIAMEQTAFKQAMEASKGTADGEEMERRAAWAEKVPPEPDGSMQATQVRLLMGDNKFVRRFGSDEPLEAVVRWICSLNSSAFDKFADGSWDLWDFTTHPLKTLACTGQDADKTLYAMDLWPAATLSVAPKGFNVTDYYKRMGWGQGHEY